MKSRIKKISERVASCPYAHLIFAFFTAAFVLLYLWANFCNRQVFNLDMYSDAQVAKLMWEQKTLFPEGWVFGNQYYVVATPVLSALFYGICGDSILAMGLASTAMLFLELALFIYLVKPFVGKTAAAAGLFAFGGAVILGTSVCNSTEGMQLLFTMASYYACYMLGILISMAVYLRLREKLKAGFLPIAAALIMSFGLGMQSLRETLVLVLPLAAVEALSFLAERKKKNLKATAFALAVAAANVSGLVLSRFVPAVSNKSITSGGVPSSFAMLLGNAKQSFEYFVGITGLNYIHHSIKWKPLFLLALVICAVTLFAVIKALRAQIKKEKDPVGFLILFLVISLCAVFAVGCLGFNLRAIYYFPWFLLAALSFAYVIDRMEMPVIKSLVMLSLLGCGAVNLFYNAYPDFVQHKAQQELFYGTAQKLIDEGIDCTYVEFTTYGSSAVAACSGDKIDSTIVQLVLDDEKGYCFKAYPHLVDMRMFSEERKENAVLILTDAKMVGTSSFATLDNNPGSREAIMDKLELMSVESNEYIDLYLYKIKDPDVIIK